MWFQAADASRERKKKLVTQQETLRFTKSLHAASSKLKPGRAKSDSDADPPRLNGDPPEVPAKPARLMSASEVGSQQYFFCNYFKHRPHFLVIYMTAYKLIVSILAFTFIMDPTLAIP